MECSSSGLIGAALHLEIRRLLNVVWFILLKRHGTNLKVFSLVRWLRRFAHITFGITFLNISRATGNAVEDLTM